MRFLHAVFLVATFCSPSVLCAAQSPSQEAPAAEVPSAPLAPSGLVQPSLNTVQQATGALKLDKWKRGTVREEADANIGAIQRDLQTTLPPLLQEADAAPQTISKMLPVSRNIDALYDVLLRVVEAARVSATPEQITQLQQSLVSLGKARHALDDRLEAAIAAQEKQLSDLRRTLQAQAAVKCPDIPAPVKQACGPPTPARKAKKKPAATPPASSSPAAATPKTGK